jgi:hypothetical protein
MSNPPKHPADVEATRIEPVQQAGSEHSPAEQVQPHNADAQDLYGPPAGQ